MRVLVRCLFAGVVCCALNLVAQSPDSDAVKVPTDMQAQAAPQPATQPQPQIYRRPGKIVVPASSIVRPEDAGLRMHTNVEIFVPAGRPLSSIIPDDTFSETPASLGCVYKVGPIYNNGCTPSGGGTNHPTGGWGAIALVDAFDNPQASHDLSTFSSHYGLPAAQFRKIYANTSYGNLHGFTASCSGTPPGDTGWGLEEDLDIEYAHAMSPSAKILLVEACSNSGDDLYFAELVAGIEVSSRGGGDISNSWGGGEFSGEVGSVDDVFYRYYGNKIVYFASAGDDGWGAQYPSSSPWVVSAGGTTINRDSGMNFLSESCWSGSGGGVSSYELWQNPPDINNGMGPWASFQFPMAGLTARQTPDFSFDADPNSGANVYDSYGYSGWLVVGGTSLASPALAGIVNASKNLLGAGNGPNFTSAENNMIYSQLYSHIAYLTNFYDVTTGNNGVAAGPGYDQCTGVGSVRGHLGK